MANNLLIVESPAKSRTIEKYLGPDFQVLSSYGHVRDLISKTGAVNPDDNFAMKYDLIERNKKHLNKIIQAIKKATGLYLATDPDREGEAISWHLYEILKEKNLLKDKKIYRVVFNEITKNAVKHAVDNPRQLSDELVNAQQARRALDHLVGFNLSPLLWRKVSTGLSAGRVQSPALRLLAEREEEIEAFKSQEYWTIAAKLEKDKQPFQAKLSAIGGKALKQFDLTTDKQSNTICDTVKSNAKGKLNVISYEKKQRKRNPPPPLITSTLQQTGVKRFSFTSSRTMRAAQQLYEGIDLGSGSIGLITYMRTDSVTLSNEALNDIRSYIKDGIGAENLPEQARRFKTKSKNAQEAHEAIRPTSATRTPDEIKSFLSEDQFKIYSIVWQRAVASQMIHATIDMVAAELSCGDEHTFKATGSTVKTPGFLHVLPDGKKAKTEENNLPVMEKGDAIDLLEVIPSQHFTEPPPRYNEASLIKMLEEYGIGRPSTYASIIKTLQDKKYAEIENKAFHPTAMGRVVNNFLTAHFSKYVDYEFTSQLEDLLDEIANGTKEWIDVLQEFWGPFNKLVKDKDETVSRKDASQARDLGIDPKTNKPVMARMGRFGPYVQLGEAEDDEKPRFASFKKGQVLENITLEEALSLLRLPRDLGVTEDDEQVSVGIGRFGPYIKYGSKYVSIKEEDPYTIEFNHALVLIKEKKEADAKKLLKDFPEQGIKVIDGRYGPYVTDGKTNAKVAKEIDIESLTLEDCLKLIEEAPVKKRGKKTASKKKTTKKKTAKRKVTKKKVAKKRTVKKKSA